MDFGKAGITIDPGPEMAARAARYEQFGFSTLWIAGGQLSSLSLVGDLIAATRSARVGTAIIPPSMYPADQVAASYAELEAAAPGRFLVGLGGLQQPKSMKALHDYLDWLDRPETSVPRERRYLAALGPRKLDLAKEHFAGAITLLVTPEFTEQVRDRFDGAARQLVEILVVGDTDGERARAAARETLGFLLQVPGYAAHAGRLGFPDAEIDRVDDRLVDALVPWGDAATVARAIRRHWDAGADQVIISPLGNTSDQFLAELADLLGLSGNDRT